MLTLLLLNRSSSTACTGGVPVKGLEDIVSRMRDLAKNRGEATRRSRRERASQRGTFRELVGGGWGGAAVAAGGQAACHWGRHVLI